MMRLFLTILLVYTVLAGDAFAQSEDTSGRTYYNRTQTSSGAPLYNSSGSSYYSKGPISIKQMLAGKGSGAADGTRHFDSVSPYGSDNNYSLSLSPDQVRARRAKRDALAKRLARKNQRKEQTAQAGYAQDELDAYRRQFVSSDGSVSSGAGAVPVSVKRRVFRKKKSALDLDVPKKVFNSVY